MEVETWAIRYLVTDTSNWWLGHKVLVAPEWIENVSWPEGKITVDLTRQTLKDAPAYDSDVPLSSDFEIHMFEYYGRTADRAGDSKRTS
jgi:hypothetical protein